METQEESQKRLLKENLEYFKEDFILENRVSIQDYVILKDGTKGKVISLLDENAIILCNTNDEKTVKCGELTLIDEVEFYREDE